MSKSYVCIFFEHNRISLTVYNYIPINPDCYISLYIRFTKRIR